MGEDLATLQIFVDEAGLLLYDKLFRTIQRVFNCVPKQMSFKIKVVGDDTHHLLIEARTSCLRLMTNNE